MVEHQHQGAFTGVSSCPVHSPITMCCTYLLSPSSTSSNDGPWFLMSASCHHHASSFYFQCLHSIPPHPWSFQEGGGEKCCVGDGWVINLTHDITPAQHPLPPWSFQEGGERSVFQPLSPRQRWYRHRQDDQGRLTNWPSSSHVQISPDPQIMSHKYKYKTIISPIGHCNRTSKYPRLHKRMSYRYKNTRQIQKGRNIVSTIDRCHRTSKYRRP